jgi:hypothetical protein
MSVTTRASARQAEAAAAGAPRTPAKRKAAQPCPAQGRSWKGVPSVGEAIAMQTDEVAVRSEAAAEWEGAAGQQEPPAVSGPGIPHGDAQVEGTPRTAVLPPATDSTQALAAIALLLQQGQASRQSTPRRPSIKLTGVQPFKGDGGQALDAWLAQLDALYDVFVVGEGAEESLFVAHAAVTLQEQAAIWWRTQRGPAQPATWAALTEALRRRFQPVGSAEDAERSLGKVAQQAKETVSEYASRFQTLLARADADAFSRKRLIAMFIDGLRDESLRGRLDDEPPSDLNAAIERASRIDGRRHPQGGAGATASAAAVETKEDKVMQTLAALGQQVSRLQEQVTRGGTPARAGGRPSAYFSKADRGAGSSSHSHRAPWSSVPGLSEAEGQRRKDEGVCFWCGEGGHRMMMCKAKAAGRPAQVN